MTTDFNAQELVPSTFEASLDDFDDTVVGSEVPAVEFEHSIDEMEAVFDVPVKVKAVLGGARVQVGELIQMRSGSVVELDRRVGEPVDVFVNDRFIARGELVLIDGLLGVTLTEIVKQDG
jgi:flagellar motor switch protein FliN